MSRRSCSGLGGHSNWHLLPVAWLLCVNAAWAQSVPAPEVAQVKPAAPATAPGADQAKGRPTPAPHPIDLYLGAASELLPQDRWDAILALQPGDADEQGDLPALGQDADVQVESARAAPKVPGGIAGLFWALRHPAQAWRVLTPAH